MLKNLLEKNNIKRVLLIDPAFPIANKSRNHKDLLPVGLLKISSYLKSRDIETKLIRLNNDENFERDIKKFDPDFVMVTSVFTYWFKEVQEAVKYSKKILPNVKVMVGGILVSLTNDNPKSELYTQNIQKKLSCDYIQKGVLSCAENIPPDYSILENGGKDIDFQIIHTSRGCKRNCKFCGVNKI